MAILGPWRIATHVESTASGPLFRLQRFRTVGGAGVSGSEETSSHDAAKVVELLCDERWRFVRVLSTGELAERRAAATRMVALHLDAHRARARGQTTPEPPLGGVLEFMTAPRKGASHRSA